MKYKCINTSHGCLSCQTIEFLIDRFTNFMIDGVHLVSKLSDLKIINAISFIVQLLNTKTLIVSYRFTVLIWFSASDCFVKFYDSHLHNIHISYKACFVLPVLCQYDLKGTSCQFILIEHWFIVWLNSICSNKRYQYFVLVY